MVRVRCCLSIESAGDGQLKLLVEEGSDEPGPIRRSEIPKQSIALFRVCARFVTNGISMARRIIARLGSSHQSKAGQARVIVGHRDDPRLLSRPELHKGKTGTP